MVLRPIQAGKHPIWHAVKAIYSFHVLYKQSFVKTSEANPSQPDELSPDTWGRTAKQSIEFHSDSIPQSDVEILCLEDDSNDCALIEYAFRKAPVRFRFFATALASLDYLSSLSPEQRAPDVLLLDIYLPGDTGLSVLSWVRKNPCFSSMPAIVITGSLVPTHPQEAKALGADAVFAKQLSFVPLVSIVFDLLEQRSSNNRECPMRLFGMRKSRGNNGPAGEELAPYDLSM